LGIKLFISYCHADESIKNDFVKFLATLKRNGIISEWNDRHLLVGDQLDDTILGKLDDSDIVCFLVTQDFLNSYYCVEKELEKALSNAINGKSRIFPIIVDYCTWTDTSLASYLASPTDGKPIKSYNNPSEAWMKVIHSIKENINKISSEKSPSLIEKVAECNSTDIFLSEINSTEISLQTRYKDNIKLTDIYIYPDLKVIMDNDAETDVTKNSEQLLTIKTPNLSVFIGEEQTGKTSLCRMSFIKKHKTGLPLIIKSKDIKKSDLSVCLAAPIREQYNISTTEFFSNDREKLAIIDDLNEIGLNKKHIEIFIDELRNVFDKVMITLDESYFYDDELINILSDFEKYEILHFGFERRDELIRKWHSLGREEEISDAELINLVDDSAANLDAIIRRNIVPRKPLYILMLLQTLESVKPSDFSLTSHGYCYQLLIQENLKKVKIKPQEIEKYINYLTQLSYFMHKNNSNELSLIQMEQFKADYSKEFLINSHDDVILKLNQAKILKVTNDKISIRYKYIYYFYIAKYIAESSSAIDMVGRLLDKMYLEKNANIIIFITHHTRNEKVIEQIIDTTISIFENEAPSNLDNKDTEFLKDFIDEIPRLITKERGSVDEERKNLLEARDVIEKENKATDEEDDEIYAGESLKNIAKSIRAIEIIGQVIKNRYSSIPRSQLNSMSNEAINVGLRFISFYLKSTEMIKYELVEIIRRLLDHEKNLPDEKIQALTKRTMMHLVYSVSYNVIRKISSSIGHRELVELYSDIRSRNTDSPAYGLLEIAIQLEFKSNKNEIPKKEIESVWKSVNSSFLSKRIMQNLVLQHQYLNYVSFQDKAWIASKLDIPIEVQEKIQSDKKMKRLSR